MNRPWLRWLRGVALAACCAAVAGCDSGGGVGVSVGLPASYGNMELGLSTSQWVGGPTW
jgi:hypothetical protein